MKIKLREKWLKIVVHLESFDPNNFGFMVKLFLINYHNQDNRNTQDFQYFTVNSCG